jgi:hypothetical protein
VVALDVTPNYMSKLGLPLQMHEMYGAKSGHIRFVMILRDPGDRTRSYFNHFRPGTERSFKEWARAGIRKLSEDPGVCLSGKYGPLTSVRVLCMSIYVHQIKAWMDEFSAAQILIVPFSEYTDNPRPALRAIAQHLGLLTKKAALKIRTIRNSEHKNSASDVAHLQSNRGAVDVSMDDALRKELGAFFRPFNERLEELIAEHAIKVVGGPDMRPF